MGVDVVIPTIGRPSLRRLLDVLASACGPARRPSRWSTTALTNGSRSTSACTRKCPCVAGRAAGPAAARNTGWRIGSAEWVAFIDDDVLPGPRWLQELAADLADLNDEVGGSQGMLKVPLPADRRPTDWERNVAGLASARWATADMAYRRAALAAVGGFDHRFPRAYREDADLAIRVQAAGFRLVKGARTVNHPVPPADRWGSVRRQAATPTTCCSVSSTAARLAGAHRASPGGGHPGYHRGRRSRNRRIDHSTACLRGAAGAAVWAAGTAELAVARIAPGRSRPAR